MTRVHLQAERAEHEAAKQQTTGADTRKLSLHVDGDTGVQSRIELDGFGVTHYIDGDADMVGELVRRWNNHNDLLAALQDLVQTIEWDETSFLNEDAEEGESNPLTRARAAINKAKTL